MHGSTAVHCIVHWRIVHVCSFLPPMQADRDGEGEAEAAEGYDQHGLLLHEHLVWGNDKSNNIKDPQEALEEYNRLLKAQGRRP